MVTTTPIDIFEMFRRQIDDTSKYWAHDRASTCGSSEVFTCARKTWFSKNGWEQDPDYKQSAGFAKRGDLIEGHWAVPAIENHLPPGVEFKFGGSDQKTLVHGFLSATPDGLLTGLSRDALKAHGVEDILSDCIITEFKSFDHRKNMTEVDPKYAAQVQSQFYLIHNTTEYRPEYGAVIAVNASDFEDVRVYIIKRDPAVGEAARKRANWIFKTKKPEDMPAEGKINGKDCQWCAYQQACQKITVSSVPTTKREDFPEETKEAFIALIQKEREYKARLTELEQMHAEAQERIKQTLRDNQSRWFRSGRYSISYTTQAGRKTYDTKAMLEDGLDLSPYEKTGQGFEKLTVKIDE